MRVPVKFTKHDGMKQDAWLCIGCHRAFSCYHTVYSIEEGTNFVPQTLCYKALCCSNSDTTFGGASRRPRSRGEQLASEAVLRFKHLSKAPGGWFGRECVRAVPSDQCCFPQATCRHAARMSLFALPGP